MPTAHRILDDLYEHSHVLPDPGNGNVIRVTQDLTICEMVSTGAETRTLAAPSKAGLRFILRMLTDGGDIVVTHSPGFNHAGESKATFNDAGDLLKLRSVETATHGTFRWQIATRRIAYRA